MWITFILMCVSDNGARCEQDQGRIVCSILPGLNRRCVLCMSTASGPQRHAVST